MSTSSTRLFWIDIARGLGIIAVVAGHYADGFLDHYLYWFHMPLFFIISGFLFKPVANWHSYRLSAVKRCIQLLVPYVSFFVVVFIIKHYYAYFTDQIHYRSTFGEFWNLLFGGQALTGFYSPFWFITCLLITQLLFSYILLKVNTLKGQLLIISLAYLLAHVESWVALNHYKIMIPWNADVALLSLTYFAFGYYGKKLLPLINHKLLFSASIIFAISFIYIERKTELHYSMDMKYLDYTNLLLDLIVPLTFSLLVIYFSYFISHFSVFRNLTYLGAASLTIMYLHIPIKYLLRETDIYNMLTFTVLGTLLPFLFSQFLLQKTAWSRFLFMGTLFTKPKKAQFTKEVI